MTASASANYLELTSDIDEIQDRLTDAAKQISQMETRNAEKDHQETERLITVKDKLRRKIKQTADMLQQSKAKKKCQQKGGILQLPSTNNAPVTTAKHRSRRRRYTSRRSRRKLTSP